MKRRDILLAAGLVAGGLLADGPAWAQADAGMLVRQAVEAAGGAPAMRQVRTLRLEGVAKHWEPDQSVVPGGEQRFLADSKITISMDATSGAARVDWDRSYQYPAVSKERYAVVMADGVGYVAYEGGTPADRAMSGYRLAAERRELMRGSPLFLLGMLDHPEHLKPMARQRVEGQEYDAVGYRLGMVDHVVMFDRATHLPARIRIRDADSLQGDSDFDLVLGDWTTEGGIKVARELTRQLNGRAAEWIKLERVAINPGLAADSFRIPDSIKAKAPREATADIPYQWYLRRAWLGRLVDSDALFYDAASSPGLSLKEVAPGVTHVAGGSHNNLIVELKDHLVVFDAPVHERQSRWVIDAAKAKFPRKPIKYVVLTHHHMDHTSGVRTYVAEGASLIVGAGAKPFFERVLAAPHRIDNDALQRHPRKAEVIEVGDQLKIADGLREVAIYRIEAKHSEATLVGYVPGAKLLYTTDLYSPIRDTRGNPNQTDLITGVERWGLSPEWVAGGHGGVGPYADLLKMRTASN